MAKLSLVQSRVYEAEYTKVLVCSVVPFRSNKLSSTNGGLMKMEFSKSFLNVLSAYRCRPRVLLFKKSWMLKKTIKPNIDNILTIKHVA